MSKLFFCYPKILHLLSILSTRLLLLFIPFNQINSNPMFGGGFSMSLVREWFLLKYGSISLFGVAFLSFQISSRSTIN